ncbi:MAG: hypothetical protein IT431_15845 [Phycisphaerales bacterium]|nr:hypothetical protein [Phycisphaerales bacterium]
MVRHRTVRTAGLVVMFLGLGAAVGCSGGGSARTDYFASRAVSRGATPGDGSVIAFGPQAAGAAWTAELSFAPTLADGEQAADGAR